ncbi:MAG: lipoprotein [Pseudomonadota bacterium]
MKPSLALNIGAAAMVLLLAGCGQPGALYMPKPPAKPAPSAPTPPPSSPAAQ